jgi:Putative addiction module component
LALGFRRATRYPEQIKAIAYMEAIAMLGRWEDFGEAVVILRSLPSEKGEGDDPQRELLCGDDVASKHITQIERTRNGYIPCAGSCARSPAVDAGLATTNPHRPLHEMSLEEKLQAMKALWENLSREPNRIEVPSWHPEVLKENECRVESGEVTFSDWEKA